MTSLLKILAAAGLSAALLAPASAGAATVSYDPDGTLRVTAAPGEDNGLSIRKNDDGTLYLGEYTWVSFTGAQDRCVRLYDTDHRYSCQMPTRVVVDLGDNDDDFSGDEVPVPVHVDGGPGDDHLQGDTHDPTPYSFAGGEGNDRLFGRSGADVLDGGPGDDELEGNGAADSLQGGDGNDKLSGDGYLNGTHADVIDGGAGTDRIEWDWLNGSDSYPPVALTLGGGADDGRAGEGDDLRNVETINLSGRSGDFTGSEGPDVIEMHQALESSTISGLGGDDRLLGAEGADVVDGGAGGDHLDGGFGDDRITGGPGADRIFGDRAGGDCGPLWCKHPYGNDTIEARDGEIDSIDCGAGTDRVVADASDVVAADCETVERGRTTPGPTPPTGPTGPAGPDTTGDKGRLVLSGKPRLRDALRRGLKIKVPGTAKTKVQVLQGKKVVAAGSGKRVVTAGFTKAARKSLARKKSVTLTVKSGALSTRVTLRR